LLTLLLLCGIAVIWAAVLGIPVLRSRGQASGDSISDFNYRLDVLSKTNGNGPSAPRAGVRASVPSATARRRRAVAVLSGAVLVTALLALGTGAPAAWALNLVADLAFGAFLVLWAWSRSLAAEQTMKVREIPTRAQSPDFALRRAASS
jgi:hypothetical protein